MCLPAYSTHLRGASQAPRPMSVFAHLSDDTKGSTASLEYIQSAARMRS